MHLRGDLETVSGVAQIVRDAPTLWINTLSRGTDRRTRLPSTATPVSAEWFADIFPAQRDKIDVVPFVSS